MPDPLLYLRAFGVAAIVCLATLLALAGLRLPASTARLNLACALGMALGLGAGYYVLAWRWVWPPVNGLDRLLTFVVPACLIVEVMAGMQRVPVRVAWLFRAGLAVAIPRVLWHGSVYLGSSDSDWSAWQTGAVWAVSSALLASVWSLLAWLSRRSPGTSIPLALGLAIYCTGLATMLAGYLKGGAAAFPLTATLLSATIGARLVGFRPVVPAVLGLGVVGLFGLLFIGRFFGRLSTAGALALLLAPLLCWATEIPCLRSRPAWLVGTVRLVLVAIALLVVLAVSKREFDRGMAPLLGQSPAARLARDSPAWPLRRVLPGRQIATRLEQ